MPSNAAGFLQTVNTKLLARAASIHEKSSVAELKEFARQLNVGGLGSMRKDELLSTIRGHITRLMMDVTLCKLVQNQLSVSIETSDAADPIESAKADSSSAATPSSSVVCTEEHPTLDPPALKLVDIVPRAEAEEQAAPTLDTSTIEKVTTNDSAPRVSPAKSSAPAKLTKPPHGATKKDNTPPKSKKRESPSQAQAASAVKLRKITDFFQVTKSSPT